MNPSRVAEIVASAIGELRVEVVTSRYDAQRADARGFHVLACDLRTQADRLERLAATLADLVRDLAA
jgi:hypothetical protein